MVIVESFRKRSPWKEDKQQRRQRLSSTRKLRIKAQDETETEQSVTMGQKRLGRLMPVKTPGRRGLVSK